MAAQLNCRRVLRQGASISRRSLSGSSRRVVQPMASASWKVEIFSHTPFDTDPKSNINVQLVDKDTGKETAPSSINPWAVKSWNKATELLPGRIRSGEINVDEKFGTPGAIVLTKTPGAGNGSYIVSVKVTSGGKELLFPCNSWVWADQKPRVFFNGALLPKDTPAGLKAWREKDLAALRGTPEENKHERKEGDRIFEYDVFNDLGSDPKWGQRKPLGSAELPFPRRLRTGRKMLSADVEYRPPKKSDPWWLPADEQFNYTKSRGFTKGALLNLVPALGSKIQEKLGNKNFTSFKEVFSLLDSEGKGTTAMLPKELPFYVPPKGGDSFDLGKLIKFNEAESLAVDATINQGVQGLTAKTNILDAVVNTGAGLFGKAREFVQQRTEEKMAGLKNFQVLFQGVDDISDILNFKLPKVLNNRWDAWHSDVEFGRQTFAGLDPVLVAAPKALPAGSAINEETVKGLLGEGETLASLFALPKPRLFLLDFVPVVEDFLDHPMDGAMHAGRCLLYKRADGFIVPVAIELKSKKAAPFEVFTPKCPGPIWLLAKSIVNNMDSFVHQGYSHYGRCHAAVEPYIISAARQLSTAHPVYQLLRPHFRYTMQINQNARKSLVNAGGTVEANFTPGHRVMELVSKVYGAIWRFDQEGLPADLKARGLMDADGNLLVDDYPYAEDGMLYWNVYKKWFKEYLSLYYKSDDEIKADPELQAWWHEVQVKGHPEKKEGWVEINTIDDMVYVLNTITWITSCHHSAVNFSQYDFSSFCLNKPAWIQKHMPAKGSSEYEALAKSKGPEFEKLYMSYMPSRGSAATIALVVKLLSNHSLDEEYVGQGNHDYIKEGPALQAFNTFCAEIKNLETTIKARNSDPAKLFRNPAKGGMPYTVMLPTSGPGVTAQGVPYSVSI